MNIKEYIKKHCSCWVGDGCYQTEIVGPKKKPPKVKHRGCLVVGKLPCDWFRTSIFPDPDTPRSICDAYADIDDRVKLRELKLCECGTELLYRERICKKCKKKRRTNGNYNKKSKK